MHSPTNRLPVRIRAHSGSEASPGRLTDHKEAIKFDAYHGVVIIGNEFPTGFRQAGLDDIIPSTNQAVPSALSANLPATPLVDVEYPPSATQSCPKSNRTGKVVGLCADGKGKNYARPIDQSEPSSQLPRSIMSDRKPSPSNLTDSRNLKTLERQVFLRGSILDCHCGETRHQPEPVG